MALELLKFWQSKLRYVTILCKPDLEKMCLVLRRVWLFVTPWNVAHHTLLSMEILQARTLEWAAIAFLQFRKVKSESEVAQLCPTLSDPMDCSLPGSSVHGIFQARVLEWGAIAFSEKWLLAAWLMLAFLGGHSRHGGLWWPTHPMFDTFLSLIDCWWFLTNPKQKSLPGSVNTNIPDVFWLRRTLGESL